MVTIRLATGASGFITRKPTNDATDREAHPQGGTILQRVRYWLFPHLLVQPTPYYKEWVAKERTENVRFWRGLFPAIALVYIGHYYLFDVPQQLQPPELWFRFRMGIVALCVATTAAYLLPRLIQSSLCRLPAAITIMVCCYTQARTIVWYDHSQYLYAFVYVVVGTTFLRTTVFASLAFASSALVLQWPSLLESGTPRIATYGAAIAALLFVAMARSKYAGDVRYFLANQGYISTQKRMIELNSEFAERIRSFLPNEISSRLSKHLTQNRLTVLQAVDQILAPAGRQIACLFTDIRGTPLPIGRGGNQRDERVISNAATRSRLVEEHRGIPRKVGDLLFAYFDDASMSSNLVRCLLAATAIVEANAQSNNTSNAGTTVDRHVLVSTGDAVVGNLGGYESSIEITALGSPVNLLSRIDELAKNPLFRKYAHERDLVLCPNTAALLQRLKLPWHIERIALTDLGTTIRDFEEIDSVWAFPSDEHNRRMLLAVNGVIKMQHDTGRAYPN